MFRCGTDSHFLAALVRRQIRWPSVGGGWLPAGRDVLPLLALTLADLEALGGVARVVSTQAGLCWDPLRSDPAESEALQHCP